MVKTYSSGYDGSFMRVGSHTGPSGQIVIMGAPFDGGTSYRSGAREAPNAIRRMSLSFDAHCDLQFPHQMSIMNVSDFGDVTARGELTPNACWLLRRKNKIVTLGGDHSVTLDLLRAYHAEFGKMAMIHFDAHQDTWTGDELNHGSFVRHAVQHEFIDPAQSIQIGIRTVAPVSHGITIVDAYEVSDKMAFIQRFLQKITLPVYLTFDVDCLDPAFAPGTGTPVSGGLTPREVYQILGLINKAMINVVGMDVVEVCPAYDHADITSLAAATVIQHMLQGGL